MSKEKYALTFEKKFQNSSDLDDFCPLEFAETFLNNNPVTGIVPTHVDDGEKDVSAGGEVRYLKENTSIEEDCLVLKANKDQKGYSGAMVKCLSRKFGNGLLEVKAKFPPFSPGVWPKMTLKATNGEVVTEVDFAQIMGKRGKNTCTLTASLYDNSFYKSINYLYSNNNNWPRFYPDALSEEKLSDGWHIFGYEQTELDAVFYIDGIEFSRIDIAHPVFAPFGTEGELILSIAVGMPRIEAPDESTIVPCSMQVEYIKFYEEVK